MKKEVAKLIVCTVGIGVIVLIAVIAAKMDNRENILERINQWPDFDVQTLEGNEISTGKLLSGSPVLFNYFSTECIFCQSEIEDVAGHTALQEAAILVFISDEEPEVIEQFRREYRLDNNSLLLFLVDSKGELRDHYRIRSVPATYLYDKNGKLIQFFRGQVKAETLYSYISTLNE